MVFDAPAVAPSAYVAIGNGWFPSCWRNAMPIDVTFDFRSDSVGDPDTHSATLRKYHRLLWSKPLPDGAMFDLSAGTPGVYLHHQSSLGDFRLSSDSVMQTFTRWKRMAS